jgi:hypothetical protein
MTTRTAVLIDERDRRVGKIQVPEICFVIQHNGCTFVRTQKTVRLHHSHRAFAVVFDQTEVYIRERLEAI